MISDPFLHINVTRPPNCDPPFHLPLTPFIPRNTENLFAAEGVDLSCGCKPEFFFRYQCYKHKDAIVRLRLLKLGNMLAYPDPEAAQDPCRDSMMYSLGKVSDFFKAMTVLHELSISLRRKTGRFELNKSILLNLCLPTEQHRSREIADYRPYDVEAASDASTGGASGGRFISPLNDRQDIELCREQREVSEGL